MINLKQQNHLTATEQEIMEVIWSAENGLSFSELLDLMNEKYDKQWKPQTLRTFLGGLQKVGLVDSRGSRKSQVYYPLYTREEYLHHWTRRLVKSTYNNSLKNFLSAFAGDDSLTEEEIKGLRDLLAQAEERKKNK